MNNMVVYKVDKVKFEAKLVAVGSKNPQTGERKDYEDDIVELGKSHFYSSYEAEAALVKPMKARITELEEEVAILRRALRRRE